jgi:hypothetical protein
MSPAGSVDEDSADWELKKRFFERYLRTRGTVVDVDTLQKGRIPRAHGSNY